MPPDLRRRAVVNPAPYWAWALVFRRDETREAVRATVETLTGDVGGLGLDTDTAWLPPGDPFRPAGPADRGVRTRRRRRRRAARPSGEAGHVSRAR
ncbi:hypothetical protein [Streptosporangium vulgare]|uniref:Uncharacterized protein n=1 Tax=Streptosporangium vulgare TaxID=46190 RepID=A0ABV5TBM5_9ACTN